MVLAVALPAAFLAEPWQACFLVLCLERVAPAWGFYPFYFLLVLASFSLGNQLAKEYATHFAEMREAGHINKLESIAIRKVEVVNGGSDGVEDFVTVLFTANLLDYTVNDRTEDIVDGSATSPVKFAEEWTWARATDTDDWLLEGIKVVSE